MRQQRILAVDDELHMLKLLERIITEKTPYRVVTTNNALAVPEMLERDDFDLVISDLKMPGLDGMDILRWIRERERREEVIIITAFGSLDTAVAALSRGVFDYITKPFRKEQIIFTVDRAMRWQRMKAEAALKASIFELEPFAAALDAFEGEYIRLLAGRCDGRTDAMAERSGLAAEVISSRLHRAEGEAE